MSKRILILLLIISSVILTFCTKKSTSPEDQLLPPSNLQITLVGENQIKLTWKDNSTNETKFLIDRKEGTFNWLENFGEVATNITSFTDNIPTNSDTVFSYRIRAFDDENFSAYSDTIAWFSDNSAPEYLQIIQIAQDTLRLIWQDNSIGEEYFRIDRKIDEKGWQTDYAHVPADTTHFLDYTTALYDTCNYKIFAVSGMSHSDSTENAFIPFLPAPNNLELQALSATEVKLTWQDNCHNEEGYRLFIKRGETAVWDSLNLPENIEEYTDENVIPGIINYYKICAYYENDKSGYVEKEINTLPAPNNLICAQLNVHTFELNWNDNSQFEQGFKIDRKIDEEEWVNNIHTTLPNATTWIDSTIGRSYNTVYYRLYAYYETYCSDNIETNSNITFPAPSNLIANPINDQEINLTWSDNSVGEEGFIVERKTTGDFIQIADLEENTICYTDTNLIYHVNYTWRVKAYTNLNESDYSNEESSKTIFPAPSNLSAELISDSEIMISWNDNCSFELGYTIERSDDGSEFTQIGDVFSDITVYNDTGLNYGIIYTYRVRAFTDLNYSNFSNAYSKLLEITAPTNLTATVVDEINIKLEWNDNSNIEEGFAIDRKIEGEEYELLETVNENISNFTDNNVENLTPYYYRIYGYTTNNYSDYSNEDYAICPKEFLVVPYDYSTIQEAIDIANVGDTVLVFPFNYVKNINFNGKNIIVGSLFLTTGDTTYISQTVIDGNQNGPVIEFSGGEDSTSCLIGFTITNGNADFGGGIYCINSSPTIIKNYIYQNVAIYRGGGIYLKLSCANIISNNIYNNTSDLEGGGIYCYNNSSPIIKNTKIYSNTSNKYGGGIFCFNESYPIIRNTIINNNFALLNGGGIGCNLNSGPFIINTVIYNNSTENNGGGICCWDFSTPIIINSIISDNIGNYGIYVSSNSSSTITYSCFWNNEGGNFYNCSGGIGTIELNPQFVDPENSDFPLQSGSSCIDAGNPDPQYNDPDDSRNDMGAYGGPGGDW